MSSISSSSEFKWLGAEHAPLWFDANWHRQPPDEIEIVFDSDLGDSELPPISVDTYGQRIFEEIQLRKSSTQFIVGSSGYLEDPDTPGFKLLMSQQALVRYENRWLLLLIWPEERRIYGERGLTHAVTPADFHIAGHRFLDLARADSRSYIQSLHAYRSTKYFSEPSNLDRIEEFENQLSDNARNLVVNIGLVLVLWEITFQEFESLPDSIAAIPDLVRFLRYIGYFALESPSYDSPIEIAKRWLGKKKRDGGPQTDNQRDAVRILVKHIDGITAQDLYESLDKNSDDSTKAAKSFFAKFNRSLRKNSAGFQITFESGRYKIDRMAS